MTNKLKEICYNLGLTKKRRKEFSKILYEEGKVVSKNYQEENNQRSTGIALGLALNNLPVGIAMGETTSEDEEFNIRFKGKKTDFEIDNERFFNAFELKEKVKIGYREVYKSTYDYVPPNFNEKQLVKKVLHKYKFISAKKLKADK